MPLDTMNDDYEKNSLDMIRQATPQPGVPRFILGIVLPMIFLIIGYFAGFSRTNPNEWGTGMALWFAMPITIGGPLIISIILVCMRLPRSVTLVGGFIAPILSLCWQHHFITTHPH